VWQAVELFAKTLLAEKKLDAACVLKLWRQASVKQLHERVLPN
jgi:hypothetical protein